MKPISTYEVGDKVVDKHGRVWPVVGVETTVIVEVFDKNGLVWPVVGGEEWVSRSTFKADEVSLFICDHKDAGGYPFATRMIDTSRLGIRHYAFCPICGESLP